jgi:hypothetical protein
MEGALEYPHVFMAVQSTRMISEVNRLEYLVRMWPGLEGWTVEGSYSQGRAILALLGPQPAQKSRPSLRAAPAPV